MSEDQHREHIQALQAIENLNNNIEHLKKEIEKKDMQLRNNALMVLNLDNQLDQWKKMYMDLAVILHETRMKLAQYEE